MSEPWMQDSLVKDIPKEKLDFLSALFQRSQGKSQKDALKELLPLLKEARKNGLSFSAEETSAAIAAIQKHSSAEENRKIETLLDRAKNMPFS